MTVRGGRYANISFSEQVTSLPNFTFHLPDRYAADELRFHTAYRWDHPGWIIRKGQRTIQKENGLETQPMSGAGLLKVFEDISGKKIPAPDEAAVIAILEARSHEWLTGKSFDPKSARLRDRLVISATTWVERREPKWLAYALAGTVLVFVAFAISITAKATMGEEFSENSN